MARKFDLISDKYNETVREVITPENWTRFLKTACFNYKLRFDEQLLLYVQKPEATAVLPIERWNRSFGRWVNRGAKGIAVFEKLDGASQRLVHYFDISDTHAGEYSRPVPIWTMRNEYTDDVIETLESGFGELERKETLAEAIMSAASNAVTDNIRDYTQDLLTGTSDSFLEDLGDNGTAAMYKELVTNSVAYMMMTRLKVDTERYFDNDDFRNIVNFNTKVTLNSLGFATSDIAEMGLSEISRTVLALQRENRRIADRGSSEYNGNTNYERGFENDRSNLHNAGGLPSSRPEPARTAEGNARTLRTDEKELSPESSQGDLLQLPDERNAGEAPDGSRTDGAGAGGQTAYSDGTAGGRDREAESGEPAEVDAPDEQSEELGTGDSESTGDIRLEWYDRSSEDKSLPFFGNTETINEMLRTTPHLKATKEEIRNFYERHTDNDERTEFIRSIFNNDITHLTLADGRTVGYKTMQNVLHLWEGSYENRTAQSFYDWGVIAGHFEGMRLLGELYDTSKPLPSQEQQRNLISDGAEEKPSAFVFSQEIIDAVLTRGSGISEGKMRIYEQFQKSLSAKENADFLKNEYGIGGVYPVITGADINEQHDGKGIRLSRGFGNDSPHITLNWNQAAKRIDELIKLDRYLSPKEKEYYPRWLEKQERLRAERAAERERREILSRQPQPEKQYEYQYHLGDKVYIGASEYEILSLGGDSVMLFDSNFPLFNKEMPRSEFDRKVQENPMNDHLKVVVTEATDQAANKNTTTVVDKAETAAPEQGEEVKLQSVVPDLRPSDVIEAERDNSYLIGKELTLDDRKFRVESVDRGGDVSMRDITFEETNGFPIFRSEKVGFVRSAIELAEQNTLAEPAWKQPKKEKTQGFDLHPEIPMADRNQFDLASHEVEEVGKKERFRRNYAAIKVLKDCREENRFATPEEQIILSKYVGWGGIPEVFDERAGSWHTEYAMLKNILSDDEYAAARESTLTAFYTPLAVISAVYKALENMGFKEGNILEPSCGVGNFIGMLPESMKNSKVYGVELDPISAGIAAQLYQKSSIAAQGFEEVNLPDSFFDAVVGNVPFGDFGVADKRYDKNHFLIHDYFFGATRS